RDAQNAQHEVAGSPVFHGTSADTDIIVASAKAYLKALNRMLVTLGHTKPSPSRMPPPHPVAAAVQEGSP
ncbi:alpha-isopropylmalate synthase regulatory domain-containing protein, partial [Paraburkholderia sp.]|uniref:alpha-isopropylmalate synthase regulatory domain-containing protein n=1 Tax=Paraburkholderia sp. TaxID=1926495 RepID=UPI0025FA2288